MATGAELAARIRAQGDHLLRLLASIEESAWTRRTDAEAWTAAEVTGHVIEMLPYWSAKGALLRNDPTAPYGRELDDPDRLAGPGLGETLGIGEARRRVAEEVASASAFLESLTAAELATPITHTDGTPETIGIMVERAMATHLEGHVGQLRELV